MPYGPCCKCGSTNYANSLGGPSICPSCDVGNSPERSREMNRGVVGMVKVYTDYASRCKMSEEELSLLRIFKTLYDYLEKSKGPYG